MSEPFLGEVRMFGFNFAPRDWAACDGQMLPINQNQSLFSLLGTSFGGDGRTTFALPDLRGRAARHPSNHAPGSKAGAETVTLTEAQLPNHDHRFQASNDVADTTVAGNNLLANSGAETLYVNPQDAVKVGGGTVSPTGGSQPHTNMQPYLTINFCIALRGLFPSRN